ncbi:MAG: hypothetical protein AB8I08_14940 [Sandaracinaceae bacterium]
MDPDSILTVVLGSAALVALFGALIGYIFYARARARRQLAVFAAELGLTPGAAAVHVPTYVVHARLSGHIEGWESAVHYLGHGDASPGSTVVSMNVSEGPRQSSGAMAWVTIHRLSNPPIGWESKLDAAFAQSCQVLVVEEFSRLMGPTFSNAPWRISPATKAAILQLPRNFYVTFDGCTAHLHGRGMHSDARPFQKALSGLRGFAEFRRA